MKDGLEKNRGSRIAWQYDEFQQIGTDYSDVAEAEKYDSVHADFRDVEAEGLQILDRLGIDSSHVLIDFGAGTGAFAIQAAQICQWVHAVDVSEAMIEQARAKAAEADVSNIQFHHAGFLTYEHVSYPVDAITTTFAFHHLPDFWKGIALKRLNEMLTPGGRLYIHDVVMAEDLAMENIAAFVEKLAAAGGRGLCEDAEKHFKEEYSTYDWVMDGLLTRAGFVIEHKQMDRGVLGTYILTRT